MSRPLFGEIMKFKIAEKEYILRPKTLEDLMWLQEQFGQDLKGMFEDGIIPIKNIIRVAYRLLADKSDFKPLEFVEYDENGNEAKSMIGGWRLLSKKLNDDITPIIEAFNEAMGFKKK